MSEEFVLIIADRNRHVREFLRREFLAEGYRVHVARDGSELLLMIDADDPPHLVVLDLDIPFAEGGSVLERLQRRTPPLPVVIHSFLTDTLSQLNGAASATIVEKCENTDYLKAAVGDMLRKFYPQRFSSSRTSDPLENVGTSQP